MKKTKSRVLSSAIIATMVLGTAFPAAVLADTQVPADETKTSVERLYGDNRYETAAKVATEGWETSKVAILASGKKENLVDALTAAPFANSVDAPILLTNGAKIPDVTIEALKKLEVKEVYTVSGVIAKEALEEAFKENELEIEIKGELGGKDRFETAKNIADQLEGVEGVMVTTAFKYADALSVASIAAAKNMPILLAHPQKGLEGQAEYLDGIKDQVKETYVLGGETLVSEEVYEELPGTDGENKTRIFGDDRFDTNLEVLKTFADLQYDKVYVGNGYDNHLVDALVVSALAAKTNSPIVLTKSELSSEAEDFLFPKLGEKSIVALGGSAVVKDEVLTFNHIRPEDFGVMQVSGVNGYSVGFRIVDGTASDLKSVEVTLYKGDTVLAQNTSLDKIFESYPTATQLSTPFNIDGSFAGDDYWTYGEFKGNAEDVPTKAVITVEYKDGRKFSVQNAKLTGDTKLLAAPAIIFGLANELTIGETVDFEVTTAPNSFVVRPEAETTRVRVKVTLTEGDKDQIDLQYLEGDETYKALPLNEENTAFFGPATGFPFTQAASKFKVAFNEAGTYKYTLEVITVAVDGQESEVLASTAGEVVVTEAPAEDNE